MQDQGLYVCHKCRTSFDHRDALAWHMKTMHVESARTERIDKGVRLEALRMWIDGDRLAWQICEDLRISKDQLDRILTDARLFKSMLAASVASELRWE